MFADRLKNRLAIQKQAGLYRNPPRIEKSAGKYIWVGNRKLINFSSNDYLGLKDSPLFVQKVAENFRKYGTSSGSSRLVSGNYTAINEAEAAYAQAFGYEDALFFSSGYQANIGVISTFFEPDDRVIFDKHIHASSVKGIQLSGAVFQGYNHSSLSHLEKRLKIGDARGTAVITESLFSMDGDLLDIAGLAKLKKQYGFFSIVDEAHAFGAWGKHGIGIASGVADVAVGTFGKAFGFFGAFVLLPKMHKEFLLNFSSPLIYSTTLPEAHAVSALDLLPLVLDNNEQREKLKNISILMKERLRQSGFSVSGDAHILAVEIGDEQMAAEFSQTLLENNIFIFPARYPTVPLGKAILRISMTALHTEEDVTHVVEVLIKAKKGIIGE